MPMSDHLLTTAEVAARLKVTSKTVYRWRAEGRIPAPIQVGRALLWQSADIDAVVAGGAA